MLQRRNLLLEISYNGKHYHGWQIQKNALTVQEVFQRALFKILGHETDIKACSRTDTNVHANSFYISFKTVSDIPCERLKMAMNNHLPRTIAAHSCVEVDYNFHARYDCISKEYIYKIWNDRVKNPFLHGYAYHYYYDIDIDKLNRAARAFVGKHDFTSFCTVDNRERDNMERTVIDFTVERNGKMVIFKVSADGFLYNMVRIMVGTLLKVAEGKVLEDEICDIIEAKDRKIAGPKAPAAGLYLNSVCYNIKEKFKDAPQDSK